MPFVLPFTLQHVSPWVTAKISIFAPWNGAFDLGARDFLFANNGCYWTNKFYLLYYLRRKKRSSFENSINFGRVLLLNE